MKVSFNLCFRFCVQGIGHVDSCAALCSAQSQVEDGGLIGVSFSVNVNRIYTIDSRYQVWRIVIKVCAILLRVNDTGLSHLEAVQGASPGPQQSPAPSPRAAQLEFVHHVHDGRLLAGAGAADDHRAAVAAQLG